MSLIFGVIWQQHSAAATHCDPELTSQLKRAARSTVSAMPGRTAAAVAGGETPVLMSGAGHDAMAMARLTKVRTYKEGRKHAWCVEWLASRPAAVLE